MKRPAPCRLLAGLLASLLVLPCAAAETRVRLQLRWLHQFQFAGYYAALHQGYYADAGLRVSIQQGGPGIEPVSEVVSGRADFGISNASLVVDFLKGQPVTLLCPVLQHSPNVLLVPRANTRLEQLAGAGPVALMEGMHDIELRAMFLREGIDAQRVDIRPYDRSLQQLLDDGFAGFSAYLSNEPWVLENAGIEYSMLLPQAYGMDFYGDTLFTRHSLVEQDPDTVAAFRQASLRGWQYALQHPDAVIQLILEHYNSQGKSREHLEYEARSLAQLINPEVIALGHNNIGRWQHIIEVYAQAGLISPQQLGSPTRSLLRDFIYDPQPVQRPGWVLPTLAGSLLALWALCLVLLSLLRLNRRLHRTQAELRDSQRLLCEAQRIARLGSWEYDIQQQTLSLNDEARQLFIPEGHDGPAQFADLLAVIHPEDRPRVLQTLEDAMQQGHDYEIDYRIHAPAGLRHIHARGHVYRDDDGQIQRMVGSALDITSQKQLEQQLQRHAHTDYLTGISNRRHFVDQAMLLVQQSCAEDSPLSVIMLDIDDFKRINDQHGHPCGDRVLVAVAEIIQQSLRSSDLVGRIGGEEFAVLLPATRLETARQIAERMRGTLHASPIHACQDVQLQVTASIGLSCRHGPHDSFEQLISQADLALYRAKQQGKNQVCLFQH